MSPNHLTTIATLAKSIGCTARTAPDGSLRILIPMDPQHNARSRRIRAVCAQLDHHCTAWTTRAWGVSCLMVMA